MRMAYVALEKRKNKDGSISYRVQVRVKQGGKVIYRESKTFPGKSLAGTWGGRRARELEEPGALENVSRLEPTIGEVLKRYAQEFGAGGRFGRSKTATLSFLQNTDLAERSAVSFKRSDVVEHIRARRKCGAGPSTAMNDLIWLRVALKRANLAWDINANVHALEEARDLLRAEGLIRKAQRRTRRPTAEELERLSQYFLSRDGRAQIPMYDIVWFAIYSARRQEEITRLLWKDLDEETYTGFLRDVKHPRQKYGNHRYFKFTREAWDIASRQPKKDVRIFPYDPKSISGAFTRACKVLEIEDLRFHDLRHEATSRLFEQGYSIEEVQLFTLHESWDVLSRYTHLRPQDVPSR